MTSECWSCFVTLQLNSCAMIWRASTRKHVLWSPMMLLVECVFAYHGSTSVSMYSSIVDTARPDAAQSAYINRTSPYGPV
eukprot:2875578-Rhodomonas_salina.3